MEISEQLKEFINKNLDLINKNTKESWEEIYEKIYWEITGKFTQIILASGITEPAKILGYIPHHYLYKSNVSNYKIPNNIRSIGSHAFAWCSSLMSVVIGGDVTQIGSSAFLYCDSLTSVEIPDSVTSIGSNAFYDCNSLTSVIFGNGLINIDVAVFAGCTSLKEIQFKGTKKEAMQLGIGNQSKKRWRIGSAIEKIICSDGEIKFN